MIEAFYTFSFGVQWLYWLMNVMTFCVYVWDKRKALLVQKRIPEVVLLLLAFVGGALGALCAMLMFRHKVRKPKFYVTVPILLLIQLVCYGILCWSGIL